MHDALSKEALVNRKMSSAKRECVMNGPFADIGIDFQNPRSVCLLINRERNFISNMKR